MLPDFLPLKRPDCPPPEFAPELAINTTLQDLPLSDFQVEVSRPTQAIAHMFEQNSMLPGAILTESGAFWGAISRRRFWERMSRPYSLDLFYRRPIRCLYEFTQTDLLVLAGSTSVAEAAHLSLQRSPELLYEPLLVQLTPQSYRLLDAHQLLIAQSRIHATTLSLLRQSSQQLEAANLELQRQASLDALTKVSNRRRLNEYLIRVWQQAERSQSPLSLILCDIDFFKLYNDTYGHLAGDACLQQVAQTLQSMVEPSAGLVARYGGEEFAVVLPNTPPADAYHLAETLRAGIAQLTIPHHQSSLGGRITLSLGVATAVPSSGSRYEELLAATDRALYTAKRAGRDRVTVAAAIASPGESWE